MPKKKKCQYRIAAMARSRSRNARGQFEIGRCSETPIESSVSEVSCESTIKDCVDLLEFDEDESDLWYHKRLIALQNYIEEDDDISDSEGDIITTKIIRKNFAIHEDCG